MFVTRRVRHRKQQFVFEQIAYFHRLACKHPVRPLGLHRQGVDFRLRARQRQDGLYPQRKFQRRKAALAAELQRAPDCKLKR